MIPEAPATVMETARRRPPASPLPETPRLVVVDDNAINLRLMSVLGQSATGLPPLCFDDPLQALEHCLREGADLVVVDYMMPGMDGLRFIEALRASDRCGDVPIAMVTAAGQAEVRRSALELGATDFLTKPIDSIEFKLRVRNLLQLGHGQNLLRDRAALLSAEVLAATQAIRDGSRELIDRLGMAAEYRDPETGGHIQRMARYSVVIARCLGMDEMYQDNILTAAPLHDVGKIATPDRVLLKPGPLDDGEWNQMRQHAEIGAALLAGSQVPLIQMACEIAGGHHEKFDGSGYPKGLAGEDIPLSARIVAVADVFDALTSVRPYKNAWTLEAARERIESDSGTHFDPRCVRALMDGWSDVLRVHAAFPS